MPELTKQKLWYPVRALWIEANRASSGTASRRNRASRAAVWSACSTRLGTITLCTRQEQNAPNFRRDSDRSLESARQNALAQTQDSGRTALSD